MAMSFFYSSSGARGEARPGVSVPALIQQAAQLNLSWQTTGKPVAIFPGLRVREDVKICRLFSLYHYIKP